MRLTFGVLVLFLLHAQAQPQPQMVWEGQVDGLSVLHVRGDRVDVEDKQGAPVQRDRHRFFQRLPEMQQDVQMQVVEGRGNVRIVQQPRPDNNFTLSVQVDDRPGGSSFYSLAFFWQTSSRAPFSFPAPSRAPSFSRGAERGEERLTWSGRVDDEVVVECRGEDCRAVGVRGAPVSRDRVTFTRPLPDRDVRVTLDAVEGRGEVTLIDNPNPGNNYTARVRIRDAQGGAADYSFSLFWTRPARNEPDRLFAKPGLRWQGRVDGVVRVAVYGSSAVAEVVQGAEVQGERAEFVRPLTPGQVPNATVRKIRGRGRVEIVDFPSPRNGYRLIFEVTDSSAGSDTYEVELGW